MMKLRKKIHRVRYSTKNIKEGTAIWYMCCCPGQDPAELAKICREKISKDALAEAFVPTYDKMKRYQGEWHIERGIVFPESFFLDSEDADKLFSELKRCGTDERFLKDMTKMETLCLHSEQEDFLNILFGKERHLKLSKGYIKDGCTYVTQGPLQGKEAMIRKIDRHKRLAKLEIPVGDGMKEMYAGLEILSKS